MQVCEYKFLAPYSIICGLCKSSRGKNRKLLEKKEIIMFSERDSPTACLRARTKVDENGAEAQAPPISRSIHEPAA